MRRGDRDEPTSNSSNGTGLLHKELLVSDIKKVGVIGCGLMGRGIAQVSASSGYETVVREVNDQLLQAGLGAIGRQLDRAVGKGKLEAADRDATFGRLSGTVSLEDLADCDIIIEAIVEDIEIKKDLFGVLDRQCPDGTIFASNTSSLTVTEMAASTERPDRFVGLHFFNPVPVMKLVEVVRTGATSDKTFDSAFAFARSLGKVPIACVDNSGFVVNRLLVPYMLDAIRAYEEGIGSIEDIDIPDGAVHPERFRGSRHPLLYRRDHVRRVPGETLRPAAAAQADVPGRIPWPEDREGLLRLLG
jgi:3-hydroxybutyryl-CoA dehydrogenase